MQERITKEKIESYRNISEKALSIAKKSISRGKEKEAKEIIEMVEAYLSDSEHFEKQEDYVTSFACLNYAHGWIDCGARLKVFLVKDRKLFAA